MRTKIVGRLVLWFLTIFCCAFGLTVRAVEFRAGDFVVTPSGVSFTSTASVVKYITNYYPRRTWLVWHSGTGTYHVSDNGGVCLFTSTNFVWAMNWALSNANSHGVHSIEIGQRYKSEYIVDAPIIADSYITIRGQGNYGTHLQLASNYPGPAIVVGSNSFISGIVRIERIRFDGAKTNSWNPMILFYRCAEPNVSECEVTQHAGPAIEIASTSNVVHWAEINRCWFVHLWGTTSALIVVRSGVQPVSELSLQGNKFGYFPQRSNLSPMVLITGDVLNLRLTGNTFFRHYVPYFYATNPVVVLRPSTSAYNWAIAGNTFQPGFGCQRIIDLDIPTNSSLYISIAANSFYGESGAVAVAVSGQATNCLVVANSVPPWMKEYSGNTAAVKAPDFEANGSSLTNIASIVLAHTNQMVQVTNDLWRARRVFVSGYSLAVGQNMNANSILVYDQSPPVGTNVFLGMDYSLMLNTNAFTARDRWWTNYFYRVYIRAGNTGDEWGSPYDFEFHPSISTVWVGRAYIMGSYRTNLVVPVNPGFPTPRIYQALVALVSRAHGATNVTFVQRTYWLEP